MPDVDPTNRPILVFDFGSQYVQLIARRVREHHAFATIVRHDLPIERVRELNPLGLIFSGGPSSVYEPGAPRIDPALLDLGVPVLGICYGMQLVCDILGGRVDSSPTREYGRTECRVMRPDDLLHDVPETSTVWMSHGDQVKAVSDDFIPLAATPTCPIAAVKHRGRPVYALQFHPEVAHTPYGSLILANFLDRICKSPGAWRIEAWLERAVRDIQAAVGPSDRVVVGVSGGVDSTVTAALVTRAIGPRAVSIFVDNGLLRAGEREEVIQSLGAQGILGEFHAVDARERFLGALAGVSDPQEKRVRIGHVFIDVFRHEAKSIPGAKFLAQGTLYPDVIESGGSTDGPAATIKHHHNVGGLPAELGFNLIEPLRDLFKDEVRRLGLELGLPEHLIWRHPFPGPGLAVRCLGEVTPERLDILRQADAIFLEELRAEGLERQIGQAFAVLLPVKSVGVMGDFRTYDNVVALRAVETDDFMTADWSRLPHDLLARTATRIINSVKAVNRVVYDITSKPPGTIEWE